MNIPMVKQSSLRRRIPSLRPLTTDAVARAVIHQIVMIWLSVLISILLFNRLNPVGSNDKEIFFLNFIFAVIFLDSDYLFIDFDTSATKIR